MSETAAQAAGADHEKAIPADHSGLRVFNARTFLIFTFASIGLCYSGLFPFSTLAGLFPGANLVLSILAAGAISLVFSILYALIGMIVPQYAADYRLASRVVHPGLAFASSFTGLVITCLFSGWLIASIFRETVTSFIRMLALLLNEKPLLNQVAVISGQYETTVSATFFMILVFAFLVLPTRVTRRILAAGFVLSLLAWALLFLQLGGGNLAAFSAGWDQYVGENQFARQVEEAARLGMVMSSSPASGMAAGLMFGFWAMIGTLSPISIAAEVQHPQITFLKISLLALVTVFIVIAAAALFLGNILPVEWVGAQSFLQQSPGYTQMTMAWLPFYAAVLAPNPGVTWLVGIIWMFAVLNMAHALMYSSSRVILAWAEDHLVPEQVGMVHPRLKSPVLAVLLVCILAEAGVVLGAVTGSALPRYSLQLAWTATLVLPLLAAILLPYKKRDWYLASPGPVRAAFGPLPLITALGILAALLLVVMLYFAGQVRQFLLLGMPVFSGMLFVFILALAWYYMCRKFYLSQGVPFDQTFIELPQE